MLYRFACDCVLNTDVAVAIYAPKPIEKMVQVVTTTGSRLMIFPVTPEDWSAFLEAVGVKQAPKSTEENDNVIVKATGQSKEEIDAATQTERQEIMSQLESMGEKFDGRWGLGTLRSTLRKAQRKTEAVPA